MSHIIGKVYDLTQENFQKVIEELEQLQSDYEALDKYAVDLRNEYDKIEAKNKELIECLAKSTDIIKGACPDYKEFIECNERLLK